MAIVHRLYVIRSISGGILGHKDIGHDSAASVYLAASLGDEFLAFVKFYAVLRIKFTVRIPVHDVHLILAVLTPPVFFLDGTSGRGEITRHCQTYRRTVGEHRLVLHKPFAERSPAYHESTVVVLDSSRKNLGR